MNRLFPFFFAAIFLPSLGHASPKPERFLIPTEQYTERAIAGWKVHVNRELLEKRAEIGGKALSLLERKLTELTTLLPKPSLQTLQTVPIWLGVDDYEKPNAVYHPSAEWLKEHGFNPEKARAVEIPNAAIFLEWSEGQPMIVLHELAHAYHHQVLGHGHKQLNTAFAAAQTSGRYDQVRYVHGTIKRAYALNNVQEFFAEMSEAYFGRNDFFPFTRDDLRQHDPDTYVLIDRLWNYSE